MYHGKPNWKTMDFVHQVFQALNDVKAIDLTYASKSGRHTSLCALYDAAQNRTILFRLTNHNYAFSVHIVEDFAEMNLIKQSINRFQLVNKLSGHHMLTPNEQHEETIKTEHWQITVTIARTTKVLNKRAGDLCVTWIDTIDDQCYSIRTVFKRKEAA